MAQPWRISAKAARPASTATLPGHQARFPVVGRLFLILPETSGSKFTPSPFNSEGPSSAGWLPWPDPKPARYFPTGVQALKSEHCSRHRTMKPSSKGEVAAAKLVSAGPVSRAGADILVDLITAGKFHVTVQLRASVSPKLSGVMMTDRSGSEAGFATDITPSAPTPGSRLSRAANGGPPGWRPGRGNYRVAAKRPGPGAIRPGAGRPGNRPPTRPGIGKC
jgi:hypothetical protein